jgi:hypothetical protein
VKIDISVDEMFEFAGRLAGRPSAVALPEPVVVITEPQAPALLPAPLIKATNGKRKYKRKATPQAVPEDGYAPRPDSAGDVLLKLIHKEPQSSADLISASRLAPGAVYSALSKLKTEGLIESRINEDGPGSLWYVR